MIVYTLVTIGIGVFLVLFFIHRASIASKFGIPFMEADQRYSPRKTDIKILLRSEATKIAVLLVVGVNGLLFILFLLPVSIGFARMLQPATVLFCGFIFFTVLTAYIIIRFNIRQSPAFFILLLVIILFSTVNDNNNIQITGQQMAQRENIESISFNGSG